MITVISHLRPKNYAYMKVSPNKISRDTGRILQTSNITRFILLARIFLLYLFLPVTEARALFKLDAVSIFF